MTVDRGPLVYRDDDGAPILVGVVTRTLGWIWRGPSYLTSAERMNVAPCLVESDSAGHVYRIDTAELMQELPGGNNYGRKREGEGKIELGAEGVAARDFLTLGGWRIMNRTGNPPGRPARGVTNPTMLEDDLRRLCRVAEIHELRRAFGKGHDAELRDRLALALYEMTSRRERPANRAALALQLGRDKATITRLIEHGEFLHQNCANSREAVKAA